MHFQQPPATVPIHTQYGGSEELSTEAGKPDSIRRTRHCRMSSACTREATEVVRMTRAIPTPCGSFSGRYEAYTTTSTSLLGQVRRGGTGAAAAWAAGRLRESRAAARQTFNRWRAGSLAAWLGTGSEAQDPPSARPGAAVPAAQSCARSGALENLVTP